MNAWKITWWDGCALRETIIPPTDAYNVVSAAANSGVATYSIIAMERLAQ